MEEIIHKFGIDGELIIVQIINFIALASVLTYFLYKPLLKVLKDREDKIAQGVKDAESAKVALDEADNEKQVIVSAAHKEAEEVAARAKVYADEKAAAIATAAEEKASTIVKQAETKGEEIKNRAHKESEAEIAKLAVLAAEKVIREKTS